MNLRHACRKLSGVFCSPKPKTSAPCSRRRDARRVKSLSEETRQKPSSRPLCKRSMAAREPGSVAELVYEREQGAVLVIGRAEIAQAQMRLGPEALRQCRGDARLADSGFARNQHDLAVPGLGARPAAQQQVDLFVAADERGQRRSAQCLKPARDGAWTHDQP